MWIGFIWLMMELISALMKIIMYLRVAENARNILILRITGFLDFSIVRYSRNYKTQRFGNWICFRPQMKGEDTYLVGSLGKS
jgi:hypothetical protein